MAVTQHRSRRKVSGGRYRVISKKKVYKGSLPTLTKMGTRKTKQVKVRGGHIKSRLLDIDVVNTFNPKTKKHEKLKIETVVDNPANKNYIRRNIITKASIVRTAKGNVKITSRPGQYASLEGILIA